VKHKYQKHRTLITVEARKTPNVGETSRPDNCACPWRINELGQISSVFSGFDTLPGCAMSSSFSFI
jgi:hypothetical protein